MGTPIRRRDKKRRISMDVQGSIGIAAIALSHEQEMSVGTGVAVRPPQAETNQAKAGTMADRSSRPRENYKAPLDSDLDGAPRLIIPFKPFAHGAIPSGPGPQCAVAGPPFLASTSPTRRSPCPSNRADSKNESRQFVPRIGLEVSSRNRAWGDVVSGIPIPSSGRLKTSLCPASDQESKRVASRS